MVQMKDVVTSDTLLNELNLYIPHGSDESGNEI